MRAEQGAMFDMRPEAGFLVPERVSLGEVPLAMIAGLPDEAAAALARIGIASVAALARANPLAILTQTPLAIDQVVDWMGQALLLDYFGEEKTGALRRFGIRTIQNLLVAWREDPPPREIVRVLCRSEDAQTVAFLGAMLRSDPLVQRLSALHGADRSQVAAMAIEATAAPRAFTKLRASKPAWHENLQALTREAYLELDRAERLRAAAPGLFAAASIAAVWALIALWRFGGAALDAIFDVAFSARLAAPAVAPPHPLGVLRFLPPGVAAVFASGLALAILFALAATFYAAFLAARPSYRAYEFLRRSAGFALGLVIGSLF